MVNKGRVVRCAYSTKVYALNPFPYFPIVPRFPWSWRKRSWSLLTEIAAYSLFLMSGVPVFRYLCRTKLHLMVVQGSR